MSQQSLSLTTDSSALLAALPTLLSDTTTHSSPASAAISNEMELPTTAPQALSPAIELDQGQTYKLCKLQRGRSGTPNHSDKSRSPSDRRRRTPRPPTPVPGNRTDSDRLLAENQELRLRTERAMEFAEACNQRGVAVAVTSMARESESAAALVNERSRVASAYSELRDVARRARLSDEEALHKEASIITEAQHAFNALREQECAFFSQATEEDRSGTACLPHIGPGSTGCPQ